METTKEPSSAQQHQQQHLQKRDSGEDGDTTPPYTGFSPNRRRFIVGVAGAAGFLGPVAGGIYLPALPVLQEAFKVGETAINATVTVHMAVNAFAPLFWTAFADWKGRRPLYILSMPLYLAATVLMAALPANYGALVFLRMAQAFGCSSLMALGAGAVADVTEPARRGFAMSLFMLGPNLAPTLGPVLGGVITGQTSWRWTFGILAITIGAVWLVIVFSFPETLRSRVGNGQLYAAARTLLWPPHLTSPLAPVSDRSPSPPRPSAASFWRLFRHPPISISSGYTALIFATYFSISVDLPAALVRGRGWTVTEVGGGYLALGAAIVAGTLSAGRFSDWRRARAARASADGTVVPEGRLTDHVWGAAACAAGAVMYGWCVSEGTHPAAVLAGTFLAGFGMASVLVVTFAFLTESAPHAAAGAMALENMLRNSAAAVVAVITPPLVAKMGHGWFFTGLALLDLVSVGVGGYLISSRGRRWRMESGFGPAAPLSRVHTTTSSDVSSTTDIEKPWEQQ